jgi:hypothetical protein
MCVSASAPHQKGAKARQRVKSRPLSPQAATARFSWRERDVHGLVIISGERACISVPCMAAANEHPIDRTEHDQRPGQGSSEVSKRLRKWGRNEMPDDPLWLVFAMHFADPMPITVRFQAVYHVPHMHYAYDRRSQVGFAALLAYSLRAHFVLCVILIQLLADVVFGFIHEMESRSGSVAPCWPTVSRASCR